MPSRIGDAILASGVVRHVRERHPEAAITLATSSLVAPMFAEIDAVKALISFDKRPLKLHWIALFLQIFRHWDLVIDVRGSLMSKLLPAHRRHAYTAHSRQARPEHRVLSAARVVARIENPPAPLIECSPATQARAARLLSGSGPLLAVAPGARWRGKIWKAERFVELALTLVDQDAQLRGGRVMLVGGPGENAIAAALTRRLGPDRVVDLVGCDLLTTFACLKHVRLFVGNDSGMMHLAAAAGAPTLGLFGPSSDELFRPWGHKTAVVRGPRPPTKTGGKQHRWDPECDHMDDLALGSVLKAATNLLKDSAGPSTLEVPFQESSFDLPLLPS